MVSEKYSQMFEVIQIIGELEYSSIEKVKSNRIHATKVVAEKNGVDKRTVMDKFSKRKMGISGVNHFDQLVYELLNGINRDLVHFSVNASRCEDDLSAIDYFFSKY